MIKNQTELHLKVIVIARYKMSTVVLIETGAERRKTARWKSSSCTGIHAYNSNTKCRKPTSSTLAQKWLRWEGQESQGPAPTVQSDITRRGGPLRLMLGYFTHIIHILAKLNKQPSATCRVPYKSSVHHCYLQLCLLFVLLPPPSSPQWKTIWKKSASSCRIQVWYAA